MSEQHDRLAATNSQTLTVPPALDRARAYDVLVGAIDQTIHDMEGAELESVIHYRRLLKHARQAAEDAGRMGR